MFKKLRCKKIYGIWYYKKLEPDSFNDLDGPIYELYNEKKEFVANFAYYNDMKCYLETGIIL